MEPLRSSPPGPAGSVPGPAQETLPGPTSNSSMASSAATTATGGREVAPVKSKDRLHSSGHRDAPSSLGTATENESAHPSTQTRHKKHRRRHHGETSADATPVSTRKEKRHGKKKHAPKHQDASRTDADLEETPTPIAAYVGGTGARCNVRDNEGGRRSSRDRTGESVLQTDSACAGSKRKKRSKRKPPTAAASTRTPQPGSFAPAEDDIAQSEVAGLRTSPRKSPNSAHKSNDVATVTRPADTGERKGTPLTSFQPTTERAALTGGSSTAKDNALEPRYAARPEQVTGRKHRNGIPFTTSGGLLESMSVSMHTANGRIQDATPRPSVIADIGEIDETTQSVPYTPTCSPVTIAKAVPEREPLECRPVLAVPGYAGNEEERVSKRVTMSERAPEVEPIDQDRQKHISAAPILIDSGGSSEHLTSEGSFEQSQEDLEEEAKKRASRKTRSMSLMLLEEEPMIPLRVPVAQEASFEGTKDTAAMTPEEIKPKGVKSQNQSDTAAMAPEEIKPDGAKSPSQLDTAAMTPEEIKPEGAKSKNQFGALTPASPAPGTSANGAETGPRFVEDLNQRLDALRSREDTDPAFRTTQSLRPRDFMRDSARLTDSGEVKLHLDMTTLEPSAMLWPFEQETTMRKKKKK